MGKIKVKLTDKRLLVKESEFASVLRNIERQGNTLSATVRQAWDTGDLGTLTKNEPAKARGAHISIIGHITEDELKHYLNRTEMANGFANRFLFACVKRSKSLSRGGKIDSVNLEPLIETLRNAIEFSQQNKRVDFDDDAGRLWDEVYPELSEGKPGLVGSVISRAEAQVVRLALLYALLDCSSVIRVEHLKAALAVWKYCEASARYVFVGATGDPTTDKIWNELQQHPDGLSRTDIRNMFARHKSEHEIKLALSALRAKRRAYCKTETTNGRHSERWYATKAT